METISNRVLQALFQEMTYQNAAVDHGKQSGKGNAEAGTGTAGKVDEPSHHDGIHKRIHLLEQGPDYKGQGEPQNLQNGLSDSQIQISAY